MSRSRDDEPYEGPDPHRVADGLDVFARRVGIPRASALSRLFRGWAEAVGPSVAAHATPVKLVRGTLTIAVDEPAWATEMRYQSARILGLVEGLVGAGVVERIEVRVKR